MEEGEWREGEEEEKGRRLPFRDEEREGKERERNVKQERPLSPLPSTSSVNEKKEEVEKVEEEEKEKELRRKSSAELREESKFGYARLIEVNILSPFIGVCIL